MARIVHIALKVDDLERTSQFYEKVFGFQPVETSKVRDHTSRHLSDGAIDQGFKSSALQAAFANGTAAHAMDFDHSFTLMGQPTAPIIPAIFALGESLAASGRQILEAYTAGFEVTGKLAHSLRDSKHDGWHAPSTLGSFGAAAGCAKLLGLSASQIEMALGIAASMASGIVGNFG